MVDQPKRFAVGHLGREEWERGKGRVTTRDSQDMGMYIVVV
jgi:hypothetical protein